MQTQKHTKSSTRIVVATTDLNSRAQIYVLLARLLYAPPDNRLIRLINGINHSPSEPIFSELPALQSLILATENIVDIESLDDEFHALFIGIGRGELVPYASWYIKGALMESPLADLRETLSLLGLERQQDICEPEDHVAAVLETMALIIADTSEYGGIQQKQFFEQHIANWMQRFFTDLQNSPTADFYRLVGMLGKQFIDLESRLVDQQTRFN